LLSAGGGGGGLPTAIAQNWQNLAGERGPSNGDQRQNFNAQLQYSTGVGVRGGALLSGWRGQIIKGWTMQSTIIVGSGMPFTPSYYSPLLGSGSYVVRPEYIGGNVYGGPGGLFLNPAAFGAPPAGQFGDVGRNSLYGPNQFSMTGSMARSFMDKYTVTVAATNILNHPVYGSPYSTFDPILGSSGQINYGKFGELLNPGGMRTISATFRWTF
jgi:trimeric autotransporter adhesin